MNHGEDRSDDIMSPSSFTLELPARSDRGAGEPLIDLSPLRELGDADLVIELAQLFIDSTRPLLDQMRQAAASADMSGVARAAHSVKGASANMCAHGLASASAALESASQRGELQATLTLVENVESLFNEVEAYLRRELALTA